MSRVPVTLQVKACKCSKGTVPSLKFRLWLENNTQVPCFWDRLRMRTVKEIDVHKMKMYWGKSGSSSGEGGGKTCTGIFCNAKPVTGKGWRGQKPERFGKVQGNLFPSKITWPQHCHSQQRMYLFCVLPSGWTASFFCWWFESIPQLCCRCPGSNAVLQRPLLSFLQPFAILEALRRGGLRYRDTNESAINKSATSGKILMLTMQWQGLNIFLWASSPPLLQ